MLTLRPIPGLPVPPGARLVPVETSDGVPLRAATWRPTTRTVKGTVCLIQGRAEFIEKYYETIHELRARGFCVVAFDWRGQGDSGRQVRDARKGHVRHFDDYRLDLLAVAEQVLVPSMPEPHFGLAHSMGGAVALTGAAEGWLPFRRLVTVAPMLGIRMVRWPAGASLLARCLHRFGLGRCYIPFGKPHSLATKPFPGNRLSTDPVRYERNAAAARIVGAGAIGDPTIAWLASAFRAMHALAKPATIRRIRIPCLIVAAGADPVCSTPATERFAARLKTGHLIVLPGARHEILTECDAVRADFWAAFDAFIPGHEMARPPVDAAQTRHAAIG
ncbi:alpha/beta fold hydrolase [Methylorubrum salsuginis]|uniref:Lysophospholipase n=1 Tax=Methylorubrum salsuginis TaxID=414703 RepID=A0A1I4G7L1_9HYPH|nr:alpha/beta hydrolase [Methylorubrum salsuginis]SFL25994.1 lysophospholipase [Methylorubrum salsuginis]